MAELKIIEIKQSIFADNDKIDVLPYFDFDMEKVVAYAKMRNPKLEIFPISAKTGEGVDAWCDWLRKNVAQWNNG